MFVPRLSVVAGPLPTSFGNELDPGAAGEFGQTPRTPGAGRGASRQRRRERRCEVVRRVRVVCRWCPECLSGSKSLPVRRTAALMGGGKAWSAGWGRVARSYGDDRAEHLARRRRAFPEPRAPCHCGVTTPAAADRPAGDGDMQLEQAIGEGPRDPRTPRRKDRAAGGTPVDKEHDCAVLSEIDRGRLTGVAGSVARATRRTVGIGPGGRTSVRAAWCEVTVRGGCSARRINSARAAERRVGGR